MKKLHLVFGLLLLSACATPPIVPEPEGFKAGALDGVWKLVDRTCEGGQLTKEGKEEQKLYRNGTFRELQIFSGNHSTDYVWALPHGKDSSSCEGRVENVIAYPSPGQYTVSNSHSFLRYVKGSKNLNCPQWELAQPRTHSYKIEGKKLKIILTVEYLASISKGPHACAKGNEVQTFERIY